MDEHSAVPVKDFPVKESQYSKHLETLNLLVFFKCMTLTSKNQVSKTCEGHSWQA